MLLLRLLAAKDRGVYVFCSLIGYLAFLALRPAAWAGEAACLVTYHAFLGHLLLSAESDEDRSRSIGLPATIAAHFGFIVVCTAARMAAVAMILDSIHSQPKLLSEVSAAMEAKAIGLVTVVLVYGLVILECKLLFSGKKSALVHDVGELEPALVEISARLRRNDTVLLSATGEDHHEWVQFCKRRSAKYYNPGLSPKDDFEQWLRARGKTHFPVSQGETGLSAKDTAPGYGD